MKAVFAVLEQELARGPVAHGWTDQTWTPTRIKTLIGRRFHKSVTLPAIAQMLHRHGFSHRVPARPAPWRRSGPWDNRCPRSGGSGPLSGSKCGSWLPGYSLRVCRGRMSRGG